MHSLAEFFRYIMNSEAIIRTGGLVLILLIVYAENGLFFAFFLPGDYLLFLSGMFCGTKTLNVPIFILVFAILCAAILGSMTGYITGRYFGNKIESRPDTFFFKKKHLLQTKSFYTRYGSKMLVISRFLPVVRTFAPILAGLIKMDYSKFIFLNILGGSLWVGSLVFGGYFLGEQFPELVHYIEYIIIFFLVVTTATVLKGYTNLKKEI